MGMCDSDLGLVILIALPGPVQPDSKFPLGYNLPTTVYIAVRLV